METKNKLLCIVDKVCEIWYRVCVLLMVCFFVAVVIVSCTEAPVTAKAITEEQRQQYIDYLDAYEKSFDFLAPPTIASTPEYIVAYAMQKLMLEQMKSDLITHNSVFDMVHTGGAGFTGFYRSYKDNEVHMVTCFQFHGFPQNVAYSDEFNVAIDYKPRADTPITTVLNYQDRSDSGRGGYIAFNARDFEFTIQDYGGYFTSPVIQEQTGQVTVTWTANQVPLQVLPKDNLGAFGSPYNTNLFFGSNSIDMNIPKWDVDIDPWDYYDDTLLPAIRESYPDIPDTELVFPNGYHPAVPDPTEPATFPSGGLDVDVDIDIDITVIYPTDEDGEPITDENGETVTETEIVSDTRPTDAIYHVNMPTMPPLDIYEATLPPIDLTPYTNGMSFLTEFGADMLERTGLLPVVLISLTLGVAGAFLFRLGG